MPITKSPRSTSRPAIRSSSVTSIGIEVIDERLAGITVVDEQPVEPLLLEHHPVVNTRRGLARRAVAVLLVDGAKDRLVIRLGPTIQG